jgi:hypothetical protein
MVLEPDLPVDFREECVIFAEPDVEAGLEAPTLLTHEDGPAGHEVAIVALHTETLRIAVAAVA